jgi:hypothetical protein
LLVAGDDEPLLEIMNPYSSSDISDKISLNCNVMELQLASQRSCNDDSIVPEVFHGMRIKEKDNKDDTQST